jgi:hypothetical protein
MWSLPQYFLGEIKPKCECLRICMASMQRDIIGGRPSELESQNGVVVRMGVESGVPTPVNAFQIWQAEFGRYLRHCYQGIH